MISEEIPNIALPQINIQTFNGYKADIKQSLVLPSQGFVSKYDPQGQYIIIGCYDGSKRLYSLKQNKMVGQTSDANQIPITCIRWRPSSQSKSKVFAMGTADGCFSYWHIPSMKKMFSIEEPQNQILCCDFRKTGDSFATAGKDCNIRIYDEETKTKTITLGNAQWNYTGHANRIFSIKFFDNNTLISGGWDSVIHFWDLRMGKSVSSICGPHIAGDTIDLKDNNILVGCYETQNQIRVFDIRNKEKIQEIDWSRGPQQAAYVYTCCYHPFDNKSIIAGACGVNEVRVFSGQNKHLTSVRLFDLKHGCFSVNGSYQTKQVAFTTAKQGFYRFKYDK